MLLNFMLSARGMILDRWLTRYIGKSFTTYLFAKAQSQQPRPALVLVSQGRVSGRLFDAVLPYSMVGEDYLVVGSSGGSAEDPNWVKNLRVNSTAQIVENRKAWEIVARFVQGEEYHRIWRQLVEEKPVYAEYQQRCMQSRQIPVIILSKV